MVSIVIESGHEPPRKPEGTGKWAAVFSKMSRGDSFLVPNEDAPRIRTAMHNWLRKTHPMGDYMIVQKKIDKHQTRFFLT